LTDTIHQLLERVRGTIARERRFTDDAAHELRTPLTAIKTHLQVLRLAAARPADAETAASALSSAERGVLRLHRTLDQLLLLARLDSGEDQYRGTIRSSADAAARLALDDVRSDWSASDRVTLQMCAEDIDVAVPEALLVSALRNLLDNALRHSPADSPVVMRVERANADQVSFSVLDSGPGLSEEECSLALQRFWRRGTGVQGSGLGLSIVAAIAQRHGGSVALRRRGSSGLEARLAFPILAPAVQDAAD
jgi:two-component system sensor histidine kinase QseC